MSCDDTGQHPVGSGGLSRVWERDPSLIDCQTGEFYPRDLGYEPLKECREECVAQRILYELQYCPYVWGDALHKIPLLLEGLLQSRIGSPKIAKPLLYWPTTKPETPTSSQSPPDNGCPSQLSIHTPKRRPSLTGRSMETQPKFSWLDPINSVAGDLLPSGCTGAGRCQQKCRLPWRHQYTMAE